MIFTVLFFHNFTTAIFVNKACIWRRYVRFKICISITYSVIQSRRYSVIFHIVQFLFLVFLPTPTPLFYLYMVTRYASVSIHQLGPRVPRPFRAWAFWCLVTYWPWNNSVSYIWHGRSLLSNTNFSLMCAFCIYVHCLQYYSFILCVAERHIIIGERSAAPISIFVVYSNIQLFPFLAARNVAITCKQ